MVTQSTIAREVGIDVSSVNKILNQVPGAKFRKDTVARVFRVARRVRYNLDRETKHSLKRKIEFLEKVAETNDLCIQALRRVLCKYVREDEIDELVKFSMSELQK